MLSSQLVWEKCCWKWDVSWPSYKNPSLLHPEVPSDVSVRGVIWNCLGTSNLSSPRIFLVGRLVVVGGWGYSGLVRSKVYKFSMRCSNSGVGRARPNLKFSVRSSNFESDQPRFSPPRIGTSHGELTCRNIGFDQSKNLTNPEYPPPPQWTSDWEVR